MTHEKSHLPNWTGLLGWSTKYHDGTSASQFGPMDPERREWLEKALNSAFDGQEDPNQVMKKAATEIQDGKLSSGLDMLEHVSDFPDCVENIDKLGALKELVELLSITDINILKRCTEVLNLYLPNNPRIQLAANLKYDCLNLLKNAIKIYSEDPVVVTGCLSTVGNLVRNVEPLERSFMKDGGIEFILETVTRTMTVGSVQKGFSLIYSLSTRHDLSPHSDMISETLCKVYSSDRFSGRELQMFEIMASVASSCALDDNSKKALEVRRVWISSQESSVREDYETELGIIREIIS